MTETPDQNVRRNPFDVHVDKLQVPTVSPSLFREVVSPNQNNENNFKWSLEQMALLRPAPIEVSPSQLMESPVDPEYEIKAQEAINT